LIARPRAFGLLRSAMRAQYRHHRAAVTVDGKSIRIGTFDSIAEASPSEPCGTGPVSARPDSFA
jgi:hypothetical protein